MSRNYLKYIFFFLMIISAFISCDKSSDITSNSGAYLYVRTSGASDTVDFGTVFTSVGSVTQRFLIHNSNSQAINIQDLKLCGGNNSFFKINVNGNADTNFQNLVINGKDSMYVYVAVNVNANNNVNPFNVSDSISISYNGKTFFVQLHAQGQNAIFCKAQEIQKDTTWTNKLPIVLMGDITVANTAKLTIEKGSKIYAHANTCLKVNGQLVANGGTDNVDRIIFTNDRLDEPYNTSSNQWRGISFGTDSKGNILNNVTVMNAYIGIADTLNNSPKSATRFTLNGCILYNHDYAALYMRNSKATVINSLITNSNAQVILENGGNYIFNYCTIAGYSSNNVMHNNPSVIIANNSENGASSLLQASFTNCIVYGDNNQQDEISTAEQGQSNFAIHFNNGLYKMNSAISGITFSNSIQNSNPQFDSTDGLHNVFNFQVKPASPAIAAASPNAVKTDILGYSRDAVKPTIGCYEFKN